MARLAFAVKALDYPGHRKVHPTPVPRLGGLAIVLGLLLGTGSVIFLMWGGWNQPIERQSLVALGLGTGLILLVGLVDDLIGVSALKKLAVECVAAGLVAHSGWQFHLLGYPGGQIELGPLAGVVLTVLWIVGVTNAINLIDGLDGLASGVVAIIGASFMIYSIAYQSPFAVAVTAGIVGCCLGFLPHNREPARIFMGDAGSLTLGYLLGCLSVYTALKSPAAVAILVPLLALGVPVIDTVLVMIVRFLERPKGVFFRRFLRMFHADRNHLHHLLETLVVSKRDVVRWIYVMVVVSCSMALVVALSKQSGLGFVLLAVELAALIVVREFGFARKARQLSRARRRDLADELLEEQQGAAQSTVAGPQPVEDLKRYGPADDERRPRRSQRVERG